MATHMTVRDLRGQAFKAPTVISTSLSGSKNNDISVCITAESSYHVVHIELTPGEALDLASALESIVQKWRM